MKRNKLIPIIILAIFSFFTVKVKAEKPEIYTIYDSAGNKKDYKEFIKEIAFFDVVLFGEMHNCPVTHWLEKMVAKELYGIHKNALVMGAEMFESDNQLILNEHLKGIISEERFENEMRLWPNYSTDYMALIDFAKEKRIPFIATNVPRRYARRVKDKGLASLDTLSSEAKNYIAPLPIPYVKNSEQIAFFESMKAMRRHSKSNPEWMSQAQAIKDATMAWFIAKHSSKGKHFLHFNGSYHSDSKEGIVAYLKNYNRKLKVGTISTTRQENIEALGEESLERADFIIVISDYFPFSY